MRIPAAFCGVFALKPTYGRVPLYPANLTQQPAASLPCGLDGDGLPIGLQLVAARHGDAAVLRAAHALYAAGAAGVPGPAAHSLG